MMLFAYVFIVLSVGIAVFQLVLAFGAPLGEYTMGGKFPGRLPPSMRVAALMQIIILALFVFVIATKAGFAFEQFYDIAGIGIWFIVVFFALGSVMNVFSPSKKERLVMGPANLVALISTFAVAIS